MFTERSVESNRILYTPSTFARSSLLYLQETGTLQALKPHISSRSHLDSYLFFTVLSGHGDLNYAGVDHHLCPGDCVFLNCDLPYSHSTGSDFWKLTWVHFTGPTMDLIYQKYKDRGGQTVFHPNENQLSEIHTLLTSLYKTASSDDHIRDMKINEQLSSLLIAVMNNSWHQDKSPTVKKNTRDAFSLEDVRKYLDEHWNQPLLLDELADHFYINKFYLSRLFKTRYDLSIMEYMTRMRITKAKHHLRFTPDSVTKIAMDCGFGDINYFSRVFRKIEGVTPTQYRKQW